MVRLHLRPGHCEGIAEGPSDGELGVEGDGEVVRHLVVDRPSGGHHGIDPHRQQGGHLGPGRATVEEDQLQAPMSSLGAEELRQAPGMRHAAPCPWTTPAAGSPVRHGRRSGRS